jgi:hypothetical protein
MLSGCGKPGSARFEYCGRDARQGAFSCWRKHIPHVNRFDRQKRGSLNNVHRHLVDPIATARHRLQLPPVRLCQ